mmetsp:Transcript_41398/g.81120  ORF Transcript_41398/g.81120 Transcript_41398/m.81120 type:complete len:322 (+) Transcript_41398:35-1000(+)
MKSVLPKETGFGSSSAGGQGLPSAVQDQIPPPVSSFVSSPTIAKPKVFLKGKATQSLEEYIDEKMYDGGEDHEWVPRNKQGNQKSCNVIRTEITRFLSSSQMTQTAFLRDIGCNSNSYGRFMKLKGPMNGIQNGVYWGAARFFEKKKLTEEWEKKHNPAAAKRKRESAAAEKKSTKSKLEDVQSKANISYTEGPIYDSCPDIRRKITAFLKSSGTTGTAFCRLIGCPANSLTRFMKHKPVPGTSGDAQKTRFQQPGAAMSIYPNAYHFFERLRLAEGQPKTKKRIENEAVLSVAHGDSFDDIPQQGFVCRHDDGKRWVFGR